MGRIELQEENLEDRDDDYENVILSALNKEMADLRLAGNSQNQSDESESAVSDLFQQIITAFDLQQDNSLLAEFPDAEKKP
jgi:hypothetical protein